MRRILLEAEGNVLARRADFYAMHGFELQFTDEAIDEVSSRALKHGTGARALRHEVDRVLRQVENRMPDMARVGIDTLIIERDAVIGKSPIVERMWRMPGPAKPSANPTPCCGRQEGRDKRRRIRRLVRFLNRSRAASDWLRGSRHPFGHRDSRQRTSCSTD